MKKRQSHGAPVKICKRGISNAFAREPFRPDYVAIFCHQFDAVSSEIDEDFTLGWLAAPFGFSASPSIFAICTEGIQRAHHITESINGPWSGWEPCHSDIFVSDAISVEADVENILVEVDGWAWC